MHAQYACDVGLVRGFPRGSDGKASACNAGDLGSILGSGRSSGEGNGIIPTIEKDILRVMICLT